MALSMSVTSAASCTFRVGKFCVISLRSHANKLYFSTKNITIQSDEPQYPPIPPPKDSKAELLRRAAAPVRDAETPAEMIYALNKRYTWNYKIHPYCLHNGFIDFFKHITKTEVVDELPDRIKTRLESEDVKKHSEYLSEHVRNVVLNDWASTYRHKQDDVHREKDIGKQMCKTLMDSMVAYLAQLNPHLQDADVDFDVEMRSFWPRGSHKFHQFLGQPLVNIRTREPLAEFASLSDDVCRGSVPDWPYDPNVISVFPKSENAVCFPGFKHGGGYLHAHTQLYVMDYKRSKMEERRLLPEVLMGQGISTSFGWLNALALYQKHCCYLDIPRPMTCQTIVTNGPSFSFYCYQLNTLALDHLQEEDNDLRNVCWQVVDLPLFSSVEDNQVHDFNEEVVKLMVAFLTNPTSSP
ncbi:large ribosomal subunit protein mL65-like [Diadema setosum]|uniref:large ribosomal subunit protein mL65-like n=1 Tax=Diadema setosum TaxID=31175 RepID=UPI003B3B8731